MIVVNLLAVLVDPCRCVAFHVLFCACSKSDLREHVFVVPQDSWFKKNNKSQNIVQVRISKVASMVKVRKSSENTSGSSAGESGGSGSSNKWLFVVGAGK